MTIFGVNYQGGVRVIETDMLKLYYFEMYDNDILIRHYIPCYRKSDGKIGLYDIVEGKFYTNEGEGEFLKGKDTGSVTSSTIVTNPSNHTLYAIWEPIS